MRGTRILWILIVTVFIGQAAITYVPWLQTVFETQAISVFDGFLIVLVGVLLFCTIEIEKQVRLKFLGKSF